MASNRDSRRSNDAERARHISASEAAAFATTAGTMLLGLIAGAEAARDAQEHRQETAPPGSDAATPPPPTEIIELPNTATWLNQHTAHAASATENITHDVAADDHAAATASLAAETKDIATTPAASDSVATDHHVIGSSTAPVIAAGATGAESMVSAPHVDSAAASADVNAPHAVTDTITGLLDNTLNTLSQTVSTLGGTLQHLTSSLASDVTQLTGTVTHALTDLTGSLTQTLSSVPTTLETLVSGLSGTNAPAPDLSAPHHDSALIDNAGAVPLPLATEHLPPLQLGFLGQPTSDGHDHHDGAFSALGVHHF